MFENKKIFVLGLARSGYEVAKLLVNYHNEILVTDLKNDDKEKEEELVMIMLLKILEFALTIQQL